MDPFDQYIALVREYVNQRRSMGRPVRHWDARSDSRAVKHGERPRDNLVLKENTAVELGGPETASCWFTLWTGDTSLLSDRRATVIGPDVQDGFQSRLPFGQVTLVAGRSLEEHSLIEIEKALHTAERIPGYSVRRTGGKVWARVSHDALHSGFSLQALGDRITRHPRRSLPDVDAAEILFVTSCEEDVHALDTIGAQVRKLSHDLRRRRLVRAADGGLECQSTLSCDECPDRPVCDDIRELISVRKKGTAQG
jgi:CO dehydrogenase/acetyl-CoA synthase beta subunit